jgi:hypothetical protein
MQLGKIEPIADIIPVGFKQNGCICEMPFLALDLLFLAKFGSSNSPQINKRISPLASFSHIPCSTVKPTPTYSKQ